VNFPPFYDQAPVVATHDALAELLGASEGGLLEYRYADAVLVAGHSCPTVAGAFLMARAAMAALYPDGPAERGNIRVEMPAPAHHGTTGVIAQVLTLLTGAAADNGFQGIAGRHARNGLLVFAGRPGADEVIFRRIDTGAAVAVQLDVSGVPGHPQTRSLLGAILQDQADDQQRAAFAAGWQERVEKLLLQYANDPEVIRVAHLN
jgi:hypothetical protein